MKPVEWHQRGNTELVIAAILGNLQAFDELVMRFRPAMLTVAEQVAGSSEAAEDIVQESLLLAFRALPQLEDIDRFSSWLHSITRHRAIRYCQESKRLEPRSDLDQFILKHSQAIVPDPFQILVRYERHARLNEAIQTLLPEHQLVVKLYYWDEIPQQAIAEFLDLPLSTVKWRLHKAKQDLRNRLGML